MNFFLQAFEDLAINVRDLLILLPIFFYMYFASKSDIASLKIPNKLNYGMFLFRILLFPVFPLTMSNVLGAVFGLLIILVPALIVYKPMGGDIKFCTSLGLWIGFAPMLYTMILAVLIFIVYGVLIKKLNKKESLPFAPFISISCILIQIFGLIINYTMI